MTIQRLYATLALAAAALLVAGCSGGNGMGGATSPPATSEVTEPDTPSDPPVVNVGPSGDDAPVEPVEPVEPDMSVSLPADHGIAEAGEHTVPADATLKVAGVRFTCEGEMDCVVTVTVDDEGAVTATYAGGEPTAAALDATGNQAFENLSAALLHVGSSEVPSELVKLRENLYHDVADVTADTSADPPIEAVDNGGGVTSSLTTHEEPAGGHDRDLPLTGVSDIFVSVDPEVVREDDDHATKVVQVLDDDATNDENLEDGITDVTMYDQVRDPHTIMDPVLVDADGEVISTRTSNFIADADWDRNPAAEWTTDPALMGATQNMDDDEDDIWTNYFQMTQDLAGGRTLHLDLRSDHDPNASALGDVLMIAEGPPSIGDDDQVRVRWDMIDMEGGDVAIDGERNLPVDDPDTDVVEGIPGSYMGVKGIFYCVEGGNTDEVNICRINRHSEDWMAVSEDDQVIFRPYVYTPDADWLAAGVWLTIPDDTEDGDYAIGAFVFGNNPYKADSVSNAQAIEDTATYAGEAFGRYAEDDAGNTETGRFTADAVLTADFGDGDAMGTIIGDLTGFVANGQSEDWDVNFEQAMIQMGMMRDPNDTDDTDGIDIVVTPESALRFNAGASGHARGHGLTGYWNGQFYGGSADGTDQPQPGSAAGTFGLTSERDDEDDYSLILGGAFATHKEEAATTTP